jgi:hypothetical protein
MKINFFTAQPFTVTIKGKDFSLSKYQKTLVIISGIAGLVLLGIGAIFTFYGASFLLRKRVFKQISEKNSLEFDNLKPGNAKRPVSQNTGLDNEKVLKMKNNFFDVLEELKPINDVESLEYFGVLRLGSTSLEVPKKAIEASDKKEVKKTLDCILDDSYSKVQQLGFQNIQDIRAEWCVIAKDNQGLFHGVILNQSTGRQTKDFYRNVEHKNKEQLMKIVVKKMGLLLHNSPLNH